MKKWLIYLIIVAAVATIGYLLYRKYKKKKECGCNDQSTANESGEVATMPEVVEPDGPQVTAEEISTEFENIERFG